MTIKDFFLKGMSDIYYFEKNTLLIIRYQKQENYLEGLGSLFHICLSGQLTGAQHTAAISHSALQFSTKTAMLFLSGVE